MTDPKKKNLGSEVELELHKDEIARNEKVARLAKTEEFAKKMKTEKRVEMDKSTGKAKPIIQKRRIQVAKPFSGKNTRVIGEDGKVLYEARPGTAKEKAMLKKLKNQEADTNRRRDRSAETVNYQIGEGEGNKVYDEKMSQQIGRKIMVRKKKK